MTKDNRSISHSFLVLIVWMLIAAYADAQSISWDNTYEQMKTSQTKSVLVHGQDSIIQTSKVNVGPNHTMDRAIFEIKRNGDQHITLCYVDLSNCGGYEVNICYCRATNEKNVVSVVLNVTANTLFSKALLQGTIYHFEKKIKSKELKLPYILDVSHAGIHVYINDRIDQLDFCNKTINQTTAVIVVEKANNELQYLFSLQDDKTSVYLKNATNFLVHSVEIKEETVLRISYEIQEIPKIRTSFKCTVRTIPQRTEGVQDNILIVTIIPSCVFAFIIILIICIICMWKRSHRHFPIQDKKYSSVECEEVDLEAKESLVTTKKDNNEKDTKKIWDLDKSRAITKLSSDSKLPSTSNTSISPVMSLPSDVLKLIKDTEGKENTETLKLLEASAIELESPLISNGDKNYHLNKLMSYQFGLMTTVTVESVSNSRPEKWPGTNVTFPYFQKDSHDGERRSRVGVGRIVSVRFIDVNDNQTLLTKSDFESHNGKKMTNWAEIDIYTSRHVVFDDQEAKDATVSLMLDIPEIPGVRLKGQRVRMSSTGIRENWIVLTCVSCDSSLFNILYERLGKYNKEWSLINEMYELFNTINTEGYFLSVSESTIKKANLTKLLDFFMKDRFSKQNSYALNTYFKDENVAIFVERTSESLSKDKEKKMETDFGNDKWILGSLPLVIKNLNTV